MVFRKWSKKEEKVKSLLISGYSRAKISKKTGISLSTVIDITTRLCYYNEIRAIPGTTKPILYEIVKNDESVLVPPKGGNSKSSTHYMADAPFLHDHAFENTSKKWNIHLKGDIKMKVLSEGELVTIRDKQNFVMAEWIGTGHPNGRIEHQARLYAYGTIKFHYRIGNKGVRNIVVFPGKIYLDNEEKEKGPDMLIDRARYISELLRPYGWRLEEPVVKGTFHWEQNNPELVKQFGGVTRAADATCWVDGSDGPLEVGTNSAERAEILNNLPDKIMGIYATQSDHEKNIADLQAKTASLELNYEKLRCTVLKNDIFLLEREKSTQEILIRNLDHDEVRSAARRTKDKDQMEAMYG